MNEELVNKYLKDINELGYEKTITLNSHDVAKILRVHSRTVGIWAKKNIGPASKKIGGTYIFTKRDVAEFLAKDR